MYLLFFVSRLRVETRSKTPVIGLRYKAASDENVEFNEQLLNAFCFPLGADAVQAKEVQASEEYTFTLTHGDGQRYTGFCRQIFPPAPRVGSKARYPQVLCVVAENPWCNFFFKVLQVAEQILKGGEGLLEAGHRELPLDSQLGAFMADLRKQLATDPAPGELLRVLVPNLLGLHGVSPPRFMGGGAGNAGEALNWADDRIELQVPPDCGNGKGNSGIPLARLLFHVPVEGMLTLIASLLLERRIVFVARSRDTVTAAVQAAQALIYPFKWHHIYLPILPRDLVDYLTAPMPFLVGLPAEMLPLIRHIPMSEVTTVDLDLQRVDPAPGSARDDGRALPYGRQLGAALQAVFKTVRSPTEYESSPLITGVMQEYFVRLFGSYRRHIHEAAMEPLLKAQWSSSAAGIAAAAAAVGAGARGGGRGGRESREGRGGGGAGADGAPSPARHAGGRVHDDMLRGHGYYFDQPAFVAQRRSEAVRSFLSAMRHSQLYQMFVQERLQMAADGAIDLPSSSSQSRSFTYSGVSGGGGGGGGGRAGVRIGAGMGSRTGAGAGMGMGKSSSASNLLELEARAGAMGGSAQLPCLRDIGEGHSEPAGGSSGGGAGPGSGGGAAASAADPFELRVQRYPEQRRALREQLRSAAAAEAAALGGGGGKLASKLRRHRRTDSEDLHGQQQQQQSFAAMHAGDSMRRIPTYPGPMDLVVPSLAEPASFFMDWDMQDDHDGDGSASPSPSPRDRDHMRSWSGNSLLSVESGEVSGPSAAPSSNAQSAASFAPGMRAAPREGREGGTPLRRLSVPAFAHNAKSSYMSLRGVPSNDSPGQSDKPPAATPAAQHSNGGARMAAFGGLFSGHGGAGDSVAATELKGGVQVKTLTDGHRVYDGSFRDIMRLAATEAKAGLLSGLSGLASPRNSPRGKDREAAAERQAREQQARGQPAYSTPAASAQVPPPSPQQQQQYSQRQQQQQQPPQQPPQQQGPAPPAAAVPLHPAPASAPVPLVRVPLPGMLAGHLQPHGPHPAPVAGAVSDGGAGPAPSRPTAYSTPTLGGSAPDDPHGGLAHSRGGERLLSLFNGLKDKVAGAGNRALGILPTPTYKPQTTGERAAKFKAQLTGGSGASLLSGADGKLKQPTAPQRPLGLAVGHFAAPPGAGPGPGVLLAPAASPAGAATPATSRAAGSDSGGGTAAGTSPPRLQPRPQSLHGLPGGTALAGRHEAAGDDFTPPAPWSLGSEAWRAGGGPAAPPTSELGRWDPFSTGGPGLAGSSAAPTPFATAAHFTPPGACSPGAAASHGAPGVGGSGRDASTGDLLGLSLLSKASTAESNVGAAGPTADPFYLSAPTVPLRPSVHGSDRLESAGSNDFAAFASATSPRGFPLATLMD